MLVTAVAGAVEPVGEDLAAIEDAWASPRAAQSVAQQSSTAQSAPNPFVGATTGAPLGDRGANLDHRRSDNFADSHR